MKTRIVLLCALLSLSCADRPLSVGQSRSAGPPRHEQLSSRFKRAESAGVFVGVSAFPSDPDLPAVPYAVDDAVDLAHAFALGASVDLIPPKRVVLAIQGEPVKPQSRQRLAELLKKEAKVIKPNRIAILRALEQQATAVGRKGLLVFSFASHGFSDDGIPYILASNSKMDRTTTSMSTALISDIAARAPRSVIFVDACRERRPSGVRAAGLLERQSFVPLINRMTSINGQVMFYAAAAGRWAYEDFQRRNGVFTAAILDALQCQAAREGKGLMTAEKLAVFVEKNVLKWIRENRNPAATVATQVNIDGQSGRMPLARCMPPVTIADVVTNGNTVTAIGTDDSILWTKDMADPVVIAEVEDLDDDEMREAVVGLHGTILAFNTDGERLWSTGTGDGHLTTFIVGDLFRKNQQVIALSSDVEDPNAARLTVIDHEGVAIGNYRHRGPLHDVFVDRLTSRHGPKIVVSGTNADLGRSAVFMLEPKRVKGNAPPDSDLWYGTLPNRVTLIEGYDCNNDRRVDIKVKTSAGTGCVDFLEGHNMNPNFPFTLHKHASRRP